MILRSIWFKRFYQPHTETFSENHLCCPSKILLSLKNVPTTWHTHPPSRKSWCKPCTLDRHEEIKTPSYSLTRSPSGFLSTHLVNNASFACTQKRTGVFLCEPTVATLKLSKKTIAYIQGKSKWKQETPMLTLEVDLSAYFVIIFWKSHCFADDDVITTNARSWGD